MKLANHITHGAIGAGKVEVACLAKREDLAREGAIKVTAELEAVVAVVVGQVVADLHAVVVLCRRQKRDRADRAKSRRD